MEKFEFKLWGGKRIGDISEYLKKHFEENETDKIYIGCDSQKYGNKTKFAIAICLYSEMLQKGAHVIYVSEKKDSIKSDSMDDGISMRLREEAMKAYEMAEYIEGVARGFFTDVSEGDKISEIHLDFNPVESRKERGRYRENKSNKLLGESVNWLKACGYKVKFKPQSVASTYAADKLCR